MTCNDEGASIECQEALLNTRKLIHSQRPHKEKSVNMIVFPFKLNIYGSASIIEELDPKIANVRSSSMLDKDDKIQGETVSGFTADKNPIKNLVKATSTHKGTKITCRDFTFAIIEIPVRYMLEKKHNLPDNVLGFSVK